MERAATCICGNQTWIIYNNHCQCTNCKKEYNWSLEATPEQATKAQDIIHLINDNY